MRSDITRWFHTDVFDTASIEVLIGRLQRVLTAITADPGQLLSTLDLLDAADHVPVGRDR